MVNTWIITIRWVNFRAWFLLWDETEYAIIFQR